MLGNTLYYTNKIVIHLVFSFDYLDLNHVNEMLYVAIVSNQ